MTGMKQEPVICKSYCACTSATKKDCLHKFPHLEGAWRCRTYHKAQCWGALCEPCDGLVIVKDEREQP